jgi:hypothetical protein
VADQSEHDEIMNDIKAAMQADTPEPVVNVVDPANEDLVELPEGDSGPARAPDGKFAPKEAKEGEDKSLESTVAPQEPVEPKPEGDKPLTPPIGWSPASKAEFAKLPEHLKADIVKREKDIAKGLEAKALEVKRYQPLEELLAPRRERWAMAGADEATAIKQLLAASDWLERDPASAIAYLAKQYNVTSAQAGSQVNVAPQQNTISRPSPEIVNLQHELLTLKEQLQQQNQTVYVEQVEAFAADPKNLYFENVREDMGILIREGRAKTLQEAYDRAIWANPETRAILIAEQASKGGNGAQEASERARKAKNAGSSVTGAPGNQSPLSVNGSGSVEDDIRAAFVELQGRA